MNKKHYNVHGGGTRGDASRNRKKELALALAVTLWLAGGGVASAANEVYLDSNGGLITGAEIPTGATAVKTAEKTLSVTGDTWPSTGNWYLYGGKSDTENLDGYTLNLSGVKNPSYAYGGYSYSGAVTGNTVTLENSTVGNLYGGWSENGNAIGNTVTLESSTVKYLTGGYARGSGNATDNTVTLKKSTVIDIYGGRSSSGDATGNTVTLENSTVTGSVYGGHSQNGSSTQNNTVTLADSTVKTLVAGGYKSTATGNILNLFNGNTVVQGRVKNFEAIKLRDSYTDPTNTVTVNLKWDTEKPMLSAAKFENIGKLDISEAETTLKAATPGTMTILSSNVNDNFKPLELKYWDGDKTLDAANDSSVEVYRVSSAKDTYNGVTLDYDATHTVSINLDGENTYKKVTYTVDGNANSLTFGEVEWKDTGALIDHATQWNTFSFDGVNVDTSNLNFTNPEAATGSMTLIAGAGALADPSNTISQSYVLNPVAGLSIDAALNGSVALSGGDLTCTVTANQATKLTFADVEWKDSGALLDHSTTLTNVSFSGADVDTSNINFTNIESLEANKKMTLVSSFGDTVGTITGTKYKVGSTLEGEGKASLVGNDLIFTAETGINNENLTPQEQTHNTVMGATVSLATLSAGNDFIGSATEGLAQVANIGDDGLSSYANIGGGTVRQETGSHVDTHTWNAILALGRKNKKEKSTFEYGAFFEYGSGNYTTHNGDERGDGSNRYTGGGLLAKWTANHGFYVEGSLRAGTVHDDARNVLRDALGNPYSYETNANYFGGHVGVGKEITLANGNVVDVYGKYFYNRRNGVSFDAGGRYDLDPVTSQIVRVGARYTIKGKKWDFYAGAAYEHELDGKATGAADGFAIRGADTSGGSFRGELGATVTPDKNGPLTLDFNLTGFAGKKQGLSGGVSVALMF